MAKDYTPPYFETSYVDGEEKLGPRHSSLSSSPLREYKPLHQLSVSQFIEEAELNRGLDMCLPRPQDPHAEMRVLRDSVFVQIRDLLVQYGKGEWSLRPRTFAILRMLGCLDALDEFIKQKRTDSFLPYSDGNLPEVIKGDDLRSKFIRLQRLVLCNLKDTPALEEGGRHLHLSVSGDTYFGKRRALSETGSRSAATVEQVFSHQTLREYARKLIHRGASAQEDTRFGRQFENEMEALKRLSHPHIVRLVGSYTDEKYLGLIMTPVADKNLDEFLRCAEPDPTLRKRRLRTFFGCLATALAYLHKQHFHHNDIKPRNVLVKDWCVYLTDFGASSWIPGEESTTVKGADYTTKYCAPEQFGTGVRRYLPG